MAQLRDSENATIAIGIEIEGRADGEGSAPRHGLDEELKTNIYIRVGEGRVAKQDCLISIEELLDLLIHVDNLARQKEEMSFEWSTVEKSVEMMKVLREGNVLHAEFHLKMYGSPEGYRGDAGVSVQFDTSAAELLIFSMDLRSELLRLVGSEAILERLSQDLESKMRAIREGRRPTFQTR